MGIFNTIYGVFLILFLILYLSLHTLSRRNLSAGSQERGGGQRELSHGASKASGAFCGESYKHPAARRRGEPVGARTACRMHCDEYRSQDGSASKGQIPLLDRCPEVCYDGHIQEAEALLPGNRRGFDAGRLGTECREHEAGTNGFGVCAALPERPGHFSETALLFCAARRIRRLFRICKEGYGL